MTLEKNPHYQLIVEYPDDGRRETHNLSDSFVRIGRVPENDIVISESTIGRRHFNLTRMTGGYSVRDERSAGGILVNGQRPQDPFSLHLLHHGDIITAGRVQFHFQALTDSE